MIKGQFGYFGNGEPLGVGGVGGGFGAVVGELDQGVVSDADDALARVAAEGAEGVELLQKDVFEAGFLGEFAAGGIIDGFVHADEAAGQSPFSFEGFEGALDQEDFEFGFVETEDDAVHGQGGTGVLVGVWHIMLFSSHTLLIV
jgi:hypothetical protein